MASLAELATQLEVGPLLLAPPVAGLLYGRLTWDAARSQQPESRDSQIGAKAVVGTLLLVGAFHFGRGMRALLHLLLTFERFGGRLKALTPDLLVGVAVVGVAGWVLFPRTNVGQFPRIRRLMAGVVALFGGVMCVEALTDLLTVTLAWRNWTGVALALSNLITSAGSLLVGGYVLSRESGIDVPPLPRALDRSSD
ncbi:MAG: hypothetical protein ACRBN8_20640 [Nannocystales bacterium]